MPLMHGKSEKAFSHNVAAEMHAGKPQKQSLAIAYATKRKAQKHKMADGGAVVDEGVCSSCGQTPCACTGMAKMAEGGLVTDGNEMGGFVKGEPGRKMDAPAEREDARGLGQHGATEQGPDDVGPFDSKRQVEMGHHNDPWDNYGTESPMMDMVGRIMQRRRDCFADGGMVTDGDEMGGFIANGEPGRKSPTGATSKEDDRRLGQHGAFEVGPMTGDSFDSQRRAEMGHHNDPWDNYGTTDHMEDMVGRIMKQRQQHFSEGGRVANETDHEAGFAPNQFDDLALRDDLEFSDTGANSGDFLSDDREDADRKDIVSRIMRSRAKKDRMPNPA